ncbi:MAG: DsbA family protein [Longimicrobiales bacterium]
MPQPRSRPPARLWFDFVDPVSYLVELELCAVESAFDQTVERVPFEMVPPPGSLTSIEDPLWTTRFAIARPIAAAAGLSVEPSRVVPWTRKAHELHLHARSLGKGDEVRLAIYRAYFGSSVDIGRIDRLVAIAEGCGLDGSTARTVLGVDRHEEDLLAARQAAAAAGVTEAPTLEVGGALHWGFRNRSDLLTLVHGARRPQR